MKNNAQNKALLDSQSSNDFVLGEDDFKRIVQSEKVSRYIFTLFDPRNTGFIETSELIDLLQSNVG